MGIYYAETQSQKNAKYIWMAYQNMHLMKPWLTVTVSSEWQKHFLFVQHE